MSWITVKVAIAKSGTPERTMYRWVRDSKLPSRVDGRRILVDADALEALINLRKDSEAASWWMRTQNPATETAEIELRPRKFWSVKLSTDRWHRYAGEYSIS